MVIKRSNSEELAKKLLFSNRLATQEKTTSNITKCDCNIRDTCNCNMERYLVDCRQPSEKATVRVVTAGQTGSQSSPHFPSITQKHEAAVQLSCTAASQSSSSPPAQLKQVGTLRFP